VTTSVLDPRNDFNINALGTFNVLEAIRKKGDKPILIYSSTNKVYGGMEKMKIIEKKGEYVYKDFPNGISEKMLLDFHSPYGCSKGAADQYVRDYERIYDIPTVVFRQSCIYGPRQFGIEDQGWVAWFIIASVLGKPITVYGDGKQVRDVLFIEDLVRLFDTAVEKIKISRGKIYNVGGGAGNILSVWNRFGPILSRLFKKKLEVKFSDWRPGDQKVYISDIRYVKKELGWSPNVQVEDGIKKLYEWVILNKKLFNIFL
jgi:CDP-paratose 2-epimerase